MSTNWLDLADRQEKARDAPTLYRAEPPPLFDDTDRSPFVRGFTHILVAPPKTGKTEMLLQVVLGWVQSGITGRVAILSEEGEWLWMTRLAELPMSVKPGEAALVPATGLNASGILSAFMQSTAEVKVIDTVRLIGIEDENDNAMVNNALRPYIGHA